MFTLHNCKRTNLTKKAMVFDIPGPGTTVTFTSMAAVKRKQQTQHGVTGAQLHHDLIANPASAPPLQECGF